MSNLKGIARYGFCIVCVVTAAGLAFYGREGWGWFLFVGLLAVLSTEC